MMEKPAETLTPVHALISKRWSPRAFADRAIEDDKLHSIFEAARWAPSSRNEQPWAFFVVTKSESESFELLLGTLMDSNRVWAQNAPALIMTLAHTVLEKDGKPNHLGFHDLGLATSNLVIQATALGLATHPMAGFHPEMARARFHVPEGWEPVSVIAVGYPGNADTLPESLRERESAPRRRKPLADFVFSESWGSPSPLVGTSKNK